MQVLAATANTDGCMIVFAPNPCISTSINVLALVFSLVFVQVLAAPANTDGYMIVLALVLVKSLIQKLIPEKTRPPTFVLALVLVGS